MYAPIVKSARTARRYDAGGYQAALLTDIEAEGSIEYQYIVAVFERGVRDPCLFVTSERNDPEEAAAFLRELGMEPPDVESDEGSHFLCVFDDRGHSNLGPSDDWADIGRFEQAALRIVAERFGETPRPAEDV
jgi:hypothetical protein